MQGANRSKAWSRLARVAALGTGALVLAGCAADYAYVQPNVAGSGGYYTSNGPYPGQGYYDDYGAGGWDDWNAFGWYGAGYGDYGYGPSFTFNLGISNAWGFPGYWGPWYPIGFPVRGCWRRDCGHHHGTGHHHHDRHDPVASSSPSLWLKPDHPRVSRLARGSAPPVEVQAHSVERLANRRPLESASFAPHDFVHAPAPPATRERFIGVPASPAYSPRVPADPVFVNREAISMPAPMAVSREAYVAPHPAFRPAPMPVPASPPQNRGNPPKTRIP